MCVPMSPSSLLLAINLAIVLTPMPFSHASNELSLQKQRNVFQSSNSPSSLLLCQIHNSVDSVLDTPCSIVLEPQYVYVYIACMNLCRCSVLPVFACVSAYARICVLMYLCVGKSLCMCVWQYDMYRMACVRFVFMNPDASRQFVTTGYVAFPVPYCL